MRRSVFTQAVLFLSFCIVYGQISTGEEPISFRRNITALRKSSNTSKVLPRFDMAKIEREDKEDEARGRPPRFGYRHEVDYNLENSGEWTNLPDGDRMWRLSISSPGALSINLLYDNFWIPDSAKFFIYGDNRKHRIGAITSANNKGNRKNIQGFATGLVFGDQITLEYYLPKSVEDVGVISIAYVVHGYRYVKSEMNTESFGSSGSCQVNINCDEGQNWQTEKNAVAMILVNGDRWCSGALVNTTANDHRPLFLTADHCLGGWANAPVTYDAIGQFDLNHWSFLWHYESPECVNSNSEPQFLSTSGAKVVANNIATDFALLELTEDPANKIGVTPYYLGWDRSGNAGTGGVGIHHPVGDVKKIATYNIAPPLTSDCFDISYQGTFLPNANFWRINWMETNNGYSVTEGGSSGSPLLNSNRRVIGQLFGAGICDNPNCSNPVLDIGNYGKISISWTSNNATDNRRRLDHWLDPGNTGVTVLDGIGDWRNDIKQAKSGDTVIVPSGTHTISVNLVVPDSVQNVVLRFNPGTEIIFEQGAGEIWVGATGRIIGTDNLKLSHDIRVHNTPYPRDPMANDHVIGLFSNICDALYRGRYGKTVKVGPGVYDYDFTIGNQGFIGTLDPAAPKDPTKSSIFRVDFGGSAPVCNYPPATPRPNIITFIKNRQLEINGDAISHGSSVFMTYGDEECVYENCIYEAVYSNPANKNFTGVRLGTPTYPLTGKVSFTNCTFRNFSTAIFADHTMEREDSPVFVNTVFENNDTDLLFNAGSQAFCGLEANQLRSVQVGQTRYTGESGINGLISASCAGTGVLPRYNYSAADPGFVDPMNSDYRLSPASPLAGVGADLSDIGAHGMNTVLTFSTFLDGTVNFGNGRTVQFENGALTANAVGNAVEFRSGYTLNLRPVNELTFKGGFVASPSTVTAWVRPGEAVPSLPNEYAVWDAAMNGVRIAGLSVGELLSSPSAPVSKNVVPDVTAPSPVTNVGAVNDNGDAVVTWNQSPEPDVARYKLFRAPLSAPFQTAQIASVPATVTEYRDVGVSAGANVYRVIAYDSVGNMSELSYGTKIYYYTGFGMSKSDTIRVTPDGVTVQIQNSDYQHGAMMTVRNRGHNDSLVVEWYGNTDQNQSGCESRRAELFGNGAQINNFVSPKRGNGTVLVNIRSATTETYLVDIEIYNWANGPGCQ